MATIKSFTDIEQSRKLAEILPTESADMGYLWNGISFSEYPACKQTIFERIENIPCWSLAALLEQLEDEITDENGNDYNLTIIKENLQYQLYYHDSWGRAEDIETDYYNDLINACVEMIIKLKERNLL